VIRRTLLGPDFKIHTAHLLRPVYLVIIAYLVGFIGEYELAAKRRLLEMISIQTEIGRSRSQIVTLARLLAHMVRFFGADYMRLQLRSTEHGVLEWEGDRSAGRRMIVRAVSNSSWTAASAEPVSYRVSHALGNWGRRAEAWSTHPSGEARPQALLVSEEPPFLARSRTRSLISIPVESPGGVHGRLLLGRKRSNFTRDDMTFCETLAAQAAVILDNVALQAKAEALAVTEERGRIARDVHDGFVQSLASIDVGIEVCRRLERKDPSRLDGELSELQSTVKQGYREARRYLERLRSGASRGPDVDEAARELVNECRARRDVQIDL
jgi:signal transduction histidine kinase